MAAQRHIQTRGGGSRHSDEAVLDAVRASVLAVGVRRTTLADVARRAGVSRMTLYRRWGDVDRLVRDLMTREFHAVVASVAEAGQGGAGQDGAGQDGAGPGGSGPGLVPAIVAAVSGLRREPLFRRVLDVDPDLLLPYVTDRLGSTQRAVVELLTAGLRAAQRDGGVRAGDPVRMAYTVLLIAQSFVLSARTVAEHLDEAALDTELTRALEAYLR
jgi:AcrR family transcriptional regulator